MESCVESSANDEKSLSNLQTRERANHLSIWRVGDGRCCAERPIRQGAQVSPHRAVLVDLVKSNGWTKGAELGVDKGVLFNILLTGCPGLHLTGVDTGVVEKRVNHVKAIVEDFPGRAVFMQMTTEEAARLVPDGSFDFVFIDADHGRASVALDIRDWQPKVRKGGWLGGHDYNDNFPGVVQAVQKAFGPRVKTWPGSIWGVWQ
jgi:predicted O-methyltransferase YrrM